MADFGLIVNHPDYQEIISKLISGSTPKEVNQWLRLKFPKDSQSHLRLTQKLLKEFVDSPFTDLHDQFKKDQSAIANNEVSAALQSNKTYKQRIEEIADKELNFITMLENLVVVTYQRVEQVFDAIQENPRAFKGDNYLLRYLDSVSQAIDKVAKLKNDSFDKAQDHNITEKALEEATAVLQESVRETFAEIDQDAANIFMEKYSQKIKSVHLNKQLSQDQKIEEARILEAKILKD